MNTPATHPRPALHPVLRWTTLLVVLCHSWPAWVLVAMRCFVLVIIILTSITFVLDLASYLLYRQKGVV
jgi:hypothetical protein